MCKTHIAARFVHRPWQSDECPQSRWRRIGYHLPRPRSIVAISAHWCIPATSATDSTALRTIHDFDGFPEETIQFQYNAPRE
jgi:aromatic ring-opening dioxygenase catalytic subunit (LigB family)